MSPAPRPPPEGRALPPAPLALARRPWHVAVGALAAGLALSQAAAPLSLAAAAALLAALAYARVPEVAVLAAALLLAGTAAGAARSDALDHASTADRGRPTRSRRAPTSSHAHEPPGSARPPRPASPDGSHAGARVLLRFEARDGTSLPSRAAIGDELSLAGSLRRPASEPEASFDFAAHLRRRGIAG